MKTRFFLLSVLAFVASAFADTAIKDPVFSGTFKGTPTVPSNYFSWASVNKSGASITDLPGVLLKANGGTGTATPNLVAGTNVSITGTWPNQTISATAGAGGYAQVQDEGTNVTVRTTINFVGAGVTVTDDGTSKTTVTIPGGGGGGAGDVVGPGSAVLNHFAQFADTTGKLLKDGGLLATVATTGAYSDLSGKPTLGTAAALNVAASGNAASGEVVKGNDTRLSGGTTGTNKLDTFVGNGSTTVFTLTAAPANNVASITLNGLTQTTGYTISGTTLTFSPAPGNTVNIGAFYSAPAGGGGGTGDFSSNTSTSVVGEAVVFSDTAGKTGKRFTVTGLVKSTSGVLAAAVADTDYLTPSGSGAALTALNASNLGSGTVPAARMPALTGDATSSSGGVATTLATVNSNVGSFTSANITVNAKGLITAAANGSGGGSGDLVATLVNSPPTTITANTTLDSTFFGKVVHLAPTSSNITITLPAIASNANKNILFVVDQAATKLVTLDANSSETIDSALTRILWKGETALLQVTSTEWNKVAEKFVPQTASIGLSSAALDDAHAQAVTTATMTQVLYDTSIANPTGAMTSTSSHNITILRPGTYAVLGLTNYEGTQITAATRVLFRLFLNGTQLEGAEVSNPGSGSYPGFTYLTYLTLAAGDVLDGRTYQNSGSTAQLSGPQLNKLTVTEVKTW